MTIFQLTDQPLLAQSYTFFEHLEKIVLYLGVMIPFALGLLLFLGLGIWWAKKLWFGLYNEAHDSRKATQDILSGYSNVVDDHAHLLQALNIDYIESLNQLSVRDKSICALNDQIAGIALERDGFKGGLDDLEAQFNELEKRSQEYVDRVDVLNGQVETRDGEIEGLKAFTLRVTKDKDFETQKLTRSLLGKDGELDAKNIRIEELQSKVNERENRINDLSEEIDALNGIHQDLANKLNDRVDTVELLTLENSGLEEQIGRLKKDSQSKADRIAELDGHLKERELEVSSLGSNNEGMTGRLVEFETEFSNLALSIDTKDNQIGGLNKDNKAKADRIAELEKRLKGRELEISTLCSDNEVMTGRLVEFETEFSNLAKSMDDKDEQVADLDSRLQDREVEFSGLIKSQQAEFESNFSKLSKSIADRDAEIERLLAEVKDKGALSKALNDRDGIIAGLQKNVEDQVEGFNRVEETLKDRELEIVGLNADRVALTNLQTDTESELMQLSKFLENKDEEIELLLEEAKEKGALSQLLAEMEDAVQTKDNELEGIRSNKNQLADQLQGLQEQAQDSDSKLSAAMAELQMTESELQKIEAEFAQAFTPLGAFRDEPNITEDRELGVIFTARPDVVDDLKEIKGVAGVLEEKLNQFGVYRFKQIAIWKQEQIDVFGEQLCFKDRITTDLWIHQAADLHREKYAENLTPQVDIYQRKVVKENAKPLPMIEQMFKGEKIIENEKLGILYAEKPAVIDDLKAIKGVAGVLEQQLNEHGVYQYKQIATWTPLHIEEFGEELCFKDRIERDLWVHQAVDLHQDKYGEYLQPRSKIYTPRALVTEKKVEVVVKEVTPEPKPAPAPFEGESVKEDQKFGLLFTERPNEIDDLKLIKGVGGVLENTLHEFGVYRFKQVALWSESVVNEFVESLPFGNRVTRDNWIDQATALHQDKYQESIAF